MKLKKGFVLRQVAKRIVAVPSGDELDLNSMITLNGTGGFLWKKLEQETDTEALVAALLEEYDVDEATARASVERFVGTLEKHGFLEEEAR